MLRQHTNAHTYKAKAGLIDTFDWLTLSVAMFWYAQIISIKTFVQNYRCCMLWLGCLQQLLLVVVAGGSGQYVHKGSGL